MADLQTGSLRIPTDKADNDLKKLARTIDEMNRKFNIFSSSVNRLERSINTLAGQVRPLSQEMQVVATAAETAQRKTEDLFRSMYRLGAGFRQTGQAVFAFAAVLSILAVPVVKKAMDGLLGVTTDYQDSLIRTAKTAGLFLSKQEELTSAGKNLGRNIEEVDINIRKLASTMPIPIEQMGRMAAVAGQLGASTSDQISNLVKWGALFASVTETAGETAVEWLGKILAAYGKLNDRGVQDLDNIINTVNMLENSTAASASQIVAAMLNAAGSAAVLNVAEDQLASLSAFLIQAGLDADEAGTALRNLFRQLAENSDKVAKVLGTSEDEILRTLGEEGGALSIIMRLVSAVQTLGSEGEQLKVLGQVFEERSLKAMARFVTDTELLTKILAEANQEWESGTSAVDEFNVSLESIKSQFTILKNNIKIVALEFMHSLYPAISRAISFAIPAVQEFGKLVGSLSERTKLMALAFGAAFIVIAPLITVLGSLGFALGLMFTGITNLIYSVGLLGTSFGPVLVVGGLLALMFKDQIPGAINFLVGHIGTLVGYLADLADSAVRWGTNVIAAFAEGMVNAVSAYIVPAINYIVGVIADFLEGNSPPKKGPLSGITKWGQSVMQAYTEGFKNFDIGKIANIKEAVGKISGLLEGHSPAKEGPLKYIMQWGANVMAAYLRGFSLADFGILSDVSRMIERALDVQVTLGKVDIQDKGKVLAGFRTLVSKAITEFNRSGKIPVELFQQLKEQFGDAGDEFGKLISMQLRYNQLQKELNVLTDKRKQISAEYRAEARAIQTNSNLTAEQKAILLAQLRERRKVSLESVDREQEMKEAERDRLETSIEWQQKFIQAMQEQDDVLRDVLETIKRLEGARSGRAGAKAAKDRLDALYEELRINRELQRQYEAAGMDVLPLLREELRIRKAITEEKLERGLDVSEDVRAMAELQSRIDSIEESRKKLSGAGALGKIPTLGEGDLDETVENIHKKMEEIKRSFDGFGERVDAARLAVRAFLVAFRGGDLDALRVAMGKSFGQLDPIVMKFFKLGQTAREKLDTITKAVKTVNDAITGFNKAVGDSGKAIENAFEKALGARGAKSISDLFKFDKLKDDPFKKLQEGNLGDFLRENAVLIIGVAAALGGLANIAFTAATKIGLFGGILPAIAARHALLGMAIGAVVGKYKRLLSVVNGLFQVKGLTFQASIASLGGLNKAIVGLVKNTSLLRKVLLILANVMLLVNPAHAISFFGAMLTYSGIAGSSLLSFKKVLLGVTNALIKLPVVGGVFNTVFLGIYGVLSRIVPVLTVVGGRLGIFTNYLSKVYKSLLVAVSGAHKFQRVVLVINKVIFDLAGRLRSIPIIGNAVYRFLWGTTNVLTNMGRILATTAKGWGGLLGGIKLVGGPLGKLLAFANVGLLRMAALLLGPLFGAFTGLVGVIGAVIGAIMGPFLIGVAIIGLLAGVVLYLAQNFDKVKAAFGEFIQNFLVAAGFATKTGEKFSLNLKKWQDLFERLKVGLAPIIGLFVLLGQIIGAFIIGILPGLGTALGNVVMGIANAFTLIVGIIGGIIEIIAAVINAIRTGDWTAVDDVIKKVVANIAASFEGVIDAVLGIMGGLLEAVWGGILSILELFGMDSETVARLKEGGKNIINGLVEGIKGALSFLFNAAKTIVTTLINAVLNLFGIGSPSKKFIEIGKALIDGLIEGIKNTLALFNIDTLFGVLFNIGSTVVSKAKEQLQNLDLAGWIGPAVESAKTKVGELIGKLGELAQKGLETLGSAASTVFNGMKKGVEVAGDALSGLKNGAVNVAEKGIGVLDGVASTFFGKFGKDAEETAGKVDSVGTAFNNVSSKGVAPIQSTIMTFFNEMLRGINVAVTAANTLRQSILDIMYKGIQVIAALVYTFFVTVAQKAGGEEGASKAIDLMTFAVVKFATKIVEVAQGIYTFFITIKNKVDDDTKSVGLLSEAVEAFKNKVNSVKDEIYKFLDTIKNKADDAEEKVDDIKEATNNYKKWLDRYAEDIIEHWGDIEEAIDGAVKKLDDFKQSQSSAPTAGSVSGGSGGEPEGAAHGGIFFHRAGNMSGYLTRVAEKEDEIIMPLSELGRFTKAIVKRNTENQSGTEQGTRIEINIVNPVVQKETDIRKLAAEVRRELVLSLK